MKKLRKTLYSLPFFLLILAISWNYTISAAGKGAQPAALKPTANQEEAAHYIAQYLLQNHYRKVPVNDSLAQQMFNRYMDNLDNSRSYFTAPEVEKLRQEVGVHLDDNFVAGNPAGGFVIYNQFLKRAREKMAFMESMVEKTKFDFSSPETLDLDRGKTARWPADQTELHEIWRKELKYQYLSMKYSGDKAKSIKSALVKGFENRLKLFNQQKPEDAFQAYMYAVTTSFDPHTVYLRRGRW